MHANDAGESSHPLHAGMPACAGVAMGLERILMLAYDKQDIADVLAFNYPLA